MLEPIPLLNGELNRNSPTLMQDAMDLHIKRAGRQDQIANELVEKNPKLNFITAYIMAGDYVTAESVTQAVNAKKLTPVKALTHIGSYARFEWAVKHLPWSRLRPKLLGLWSGSDPDDTNLEYLELFRRRAAGEARGYAFDKRPLPRGRKPLTVYRGQRADDPWGLSWTLDRNIAVKFAQGAGARCAVNGTVFNMQVERKHILAFITGRGEAEVIVDIEKVGLL